MLSPLTALTHLSFVPACSLAPLTTLVSMEDLVLHGGKIDSIDVFTQVLRCAPCIPASDWRRRFHLCCLRFLHPATWQADVHCMNIKVSKVQRQGESRHCVMQDLDVALRAMSCLTSVDLHPGFRSNPWFMTSAQMQQRLQAGGHDAT